MPAKETAVFDSILGLPLHPLVVHGVVVLLPLMALVTVVVAVRARWRQRLAWPLVVVNLGVAGMAFTAKESGEALARRLTGLDISAHESWGKAQIVGVAHPAHRSGWVPASVGSRWWAADQAGWVARWSWATSRTVGARSLVRNRTYSQCPSTTAMAQPPPTAAPASTSVSQ